MNRRQLLKSMFLTPIGIAIAPELKSEVVKPESDWQECTEKPITGCTCHTHVVSVDDLPCHTHTLSFCPVHMYMDHGVAYFNQIAV